MTTVGGPGDVVAHSYLMACVFAEGLKTMSKDPNSNGYSSNLEELIEFLDTRIRFCLDIRLGADWLIEVPTQDYVSVHYCLGGRGYLQAVGKLHTLGTGDLVVVPSRTSVCIGSTSKDAVVTHRRRLAAERLLPVGNKIQVHRVLALESVTTLSMVSIYFRARFGALANPFDVMAHPLVLSIDGPAMTAFQFKSAMDDLTTSLLGAHAMMELSLRQALIVALRQAAVSDDLWPHLAAAARDPKIARAYAVMLAKPEASHTVASLADLVSLSRSAFMSRFSQAIGCPPMYALRYARMRRAVVLLASPGLSIEQVARVVGYRSPSSFCRAFQSVMGHEPNDVRSHLLSQAEEVLWAL